MDIAAWLRKLGLERYERAFRDNEIDAPILPTLTAEDLKDLGVTVVGHRRRLMNAIAALRDEAEPAPAPPDKAGAPTPHEPPTLEAERRQLTVLFSDLVGSTELARHLDPEDTGALVRAYHAACRDVIGRWDGHIAKYLGDGVLAYFGWPQAHEDDAERAVRAGLELTAAIGGVKTEHDVALAARIGIATGLVMVGELIGEGAAQEQAVVGETPNLAARLQALAEPGAVVVAASTRRLLGGLFELDDLGPQSFKGFAEPLSVFRVVAESTAESRFEALHGRQLTPLVGREHELGLLLERWQRARDGEGQVLLSGEPGIGKSRIVRALRARLGDEPYTPLSHYCSPFHVNSALHPVIALLERAAGFSRDDAAEIRLAKLEALLARATDEPGEAVPLVASLLGIPTERKYPPLELTPQRQRQRTLEVLVDQVEGLARHQPVLVIYEDMHWADPTTLELLGLVVERVQNLPVLVLITFRPEFSPPWTGHAHVTQLSLSRLTRRHGGALIERVTGSKALPGDVRDQILARTDGVPLFVEELTKSVLESSLLRDAGDRFELDGPLPALAIPSSLHDSLMARLDRLAPVKEIAQIGAVIGREFSHGLLAAVADRPEAELAAALDRLIASELVFRRGTPPDATYSFKHALVQDAAYESLLKSKRQQLHTRTAQVLEERFREHVETGPELVAHHLTEAGVHETAVDYWTKAGQRAVERFATVEAVGHFSRGLALIDRLPKSDRRDQQELRLLASLGPPLMASRGIGAPEVGEVYARARALCDRFADSQLLAAILQGLRVFHGTRGELEASREAGHALLELARMSDDRDCRLEAHRGLAVTFYFCGDFIGSRQHSEEGIELYDAERHRSHAFHYDADPGVTLHSYAGWALHALGFPEQALRQSELALAVAHASSHPYSLVEAMAWRTQLAFMRRDPAETLHFAEETLRLATDQHFPLYAAISMIRRGWALAARGDGEQGVAVMRQGLAAETDTGARVSHPQYEAMLAEALGGLGQVTEAIALVDQALELICQTNSRSWEAEAYRIKGDLLLRRDRLSDTVEAAYRRAIEVAQAQQAKTWELRAATSLSRLWAERGERQKAHDLLTPVYEWFTEGFETKDLKDAKALLDQLR